MAGRRLAARAWLGRTFESLHERNVRILWFATFPNHAGPMMAGTAQGVVAFDLTGRNGAVGAVLLGQGLAMALVAPVAGALADRLSKRTMLLAAQAILLVTFASLAVAIRTGVVTLGALIICSFVMGITFVFLRAVRSSYLSEVAPEPIRPNAIALQQVNQALAQITAPFFAGALLAWSVVGPAGTYFVIAGMLLMGTLIAIQLPPTRARAAQAGGSGIIEDSLAGLRYGWNNAQLRWVLGAFLLFALVGMPYISLMPGYVSEVLGRKTATLGLLLGIAALGGLVVNLSLAGVIGSRRAPYLMLISQAVFATALIGLSVAPGFGAALAVMFVVGAGSGGVQLLSLSLSLQAADSAYLGRVASLTMFGIAFNGVASLPVGVLADEWGVQTLLAVLGVAGLAATAVLAVWRMRMAPAAEA